MVLDDPTFAATVEELRSLQSRGAELSELLEFAKARAGYRQTLVACALFYRAFDLPIAGVLSLAHWSGFEKDYDRDGASAAELDAECGELIRARARARDTQ